MKMKKLACFAAVVAVVGVCVFLTFERSKTEVRVDKAKASRLIAAADSPQASSSSAGVQAFQVASNQTATVRGTKPYVLTSETPFQKSLRVAAESLGARTVGVLSANSLLIEADEATLARLSADSRFSGAAEYVPSRKLSPELAAALSAGAESVQVAVLTLADADRLPVQKRVAAAGGEILKGALNSGSSFRATLSAKTVCDLVACGDVRWMEVYKRPQLMNDRAVEPAAMDVQRVWKDEQSFPAGLSGVGQVISTSDSGIDTGDLETMHPDLKNQVAGIFVSEGCDKYDVQGHGTHTAGSIVGDGTMSTNEIRGTAWGAKLLAWFCGKAASPRSIFTPTSYDELFRPDPQQPTFIHSASWGSSMKGEYTTDCQQLDEFVWANPDFLPVFSAGNDGSGASTIGSPAAAKNVLSVGATQNTRTGTYGGCPSGNPDKTADFSSRGPCVDGRIKPEICAPGTGVLSTRAYAMSYSYGVGANTNYAYDCGTSMSCPLTAGAVALVREWLVTRGENFANVDDREYTNDVPTAALMKAVITGGAKGAQRPGNEQGWGRVDIGETLFPSDGRAVKLVDAIPFAEGAEFSWVVRTTNAAPFDVQLAWIDYPGSGSLVNGLQLVNDLDLTVEALEQGDGTLQLGNGGLTADFKNNIESVRVVDAPDDLYLITVKCRRILHDSTEGGAAALYVRGAFDPAASQKGAERIRIVTDDGATTNGYYSLDKALANVKAGETIEILKPVNLRKTCTNLVDCTIMATNDVPVDEMVTRLNGAKLVVGSDTTLTLSNVAFSDSTDALVDVLAGGRLVLGEAVGLGVDADSVAVSTAAADGFALQGALTGPLTLRCFGMRNVDEAFGALAGTFGGSAATNAAQLIVNAYDTTREMRGSVTDDGMLVWKVLPCPLADAAGYLVVGTETNAYARLDRVAAELEKALEAGLPVSEVVLRKSDTLTRTLTVTADLTIRGEGNVTIRPTANDAGIVVASGHLTLDDLGFEGYDGKGAVLTVDGGELTLGEGVTLRNIVGWSAHSAALFVRQGKATSKATFENCRNGSKLNTAGGGAITVGCADTWKAGNYSLVIDGGSIVGCWAQVCGGGVFAYDKASVTIGGRLTVKGNQYGTKGYADDICIYSTKVSFNLAEQGLCGSKDSVGIRRLGSTGMAVGHSFIGAAGLTSPAVEDSAFALFNDANPDYGIALAADGNTLQWTEPVREDYSTEVEAEKRVRIAREGSELNGKCYRRVDYAFDALTNDVSTAAATLEVLKDVDFSSDLIVDFPLTIQSTGSVARTIARQSTTARIVVTANGDLCLSNVTFDCGKGRNGFIFVSGGTLTLDDGATIDGAVGSADRASGAITVWNKATFNMFSGAVITNCANTFWDAGTQNGYGGGLLVDNNSTANISGGLITGCASSSGCGVFVNNGSRINLSGDIRIIDNGFDNLRVSQDSELWVVGPLTGDAEIGYSDSARTSGTDARLFGRARKSATLTAADIADAARRFCHDLTLDRGQAVHQSGVSLYQLVWGSAIVDGKYTSPDGKTVYVYDDLGTPVKIDKPTAAVGLVYNGHVQVGVAKGVGYSVAGVYEAADVGTYAATVTLGDGFAWSDSSSDKSFTLEWSIAKADYDLSGFSFVTNCVYDGTEKLITTAGALPDGLKVTLEKNSGGRVVAGTYGPVTAVFSGVDANHNAPADVELWLVIEKAEYDLSGVVFESREFIYDGLAKSLELVEATLPDGVRLDHYVGNGVTGTNMSNEEFQVLAYLVGDEKNHVAPIPPLAATLTIVRNQDKLAHDKPLPPAPVVTVVTNHPTRIAFKSISHLNASTWTLVVTNRVPYCNYRLLYTDDLSKGFVNTGAWEQAVGAADDVRVWTTNVETGVGQWYWKAEAIEGTNVVIETEAP